MRLNRLTVLSALALVLVVGAAAQADFIAGGAGGGKITGITQVQGGNTTAWGANYVPAVTVPGLIANATGPAYTSPYGFPGNGTVWGDITNVNAAGVISPTDIFDLTLNNNYDLTSFYLWNYNHASPNIGVGTFKLYGSPDLVSAFTQIGGTYTTAIAASKATADVFAISANNVKRVRVELLTNGGSNGLMVCAGEFAMAGTVTVPEPSTIVLLVTGLVGLLAYAWRKRK